MTRPELRRHAGDIRGGKAGPLPSIALAAQRRQTQVGPRSQQVHRVVFLGKRRGAALRVARTDAQDAFVPAGVIHRAGVGQLMVARAGDDQHAPGGGVVRRVPQSAAAREGAGGNVDNAAAVLVHRVPDGLSSHVAAAADLPPVLVRRAVYQRHKGGRGTQAPKTGRLAAHDDGGHRRAVAQPVLGAVLRADVAASRRDALLRDDGAGNAAVNDRNAKPLALLRRKGGEGEERDGE